MSNKNTYRMVVSALAIVTSQGTTYAAQVSATDLNLLTGKKLFLAGDKLRVTRAFDTVMQGGLEVAGIPPMRMGAELVAAGLCAFVDPLNWASLATWIGERHSVAALAKGNVEKAGASRPMSGEQIYHMAGLAFDEDEGYIESFKAKLAALIDPELAAEVVEA